jgi:hypothetical protein
MTGKDLAISAGGRGATDESAYVENEDGGANIKPDNDDENFNLREEEQKLRDAILLKRRQLEALQERRLKVEQTRQETLRLQQKWLHRQNDAQQKHTLCLRQVESCLSRRLQVQVRLRILRNLNPLNDCFHIWHRGVYGTINGFRLGTFVPPVAAAICPTETYTTSNNGAAISNQIGGGAGSASSSFLEFDLSTLFLDPVGIGFGFPSGAPSSQTDLAGGNGSAASVAPSRVTWSEINSGLGTAALLLVSLQSIPEANIRFTKYYIIPMGNFSKIVTKKTSTNTSSTIYNLYSDDRFSFFGKRNFNSALNGFLHCLNNAAECLLRHHTKSMTLPHPITTDSSGELLIGGLTIVHGTDGDRWTRALKYMLTDLKWLVAFVIKHVSR